MYSVSDISQEEPHYSLHHFIFIVRLIYHSFLACKMLGLHYAYNVM